MGTWWVFENPRTKTAFWMTFLLPFFGGYLYAGWRAILLVPAALFGGLIMVIISFGFAILVASAICGADGPFSSCAPGRDFLRVTFFGLFPLLVIGSLVIFGLGAAWLARGQSDSD